MSLHAANLEQEGQRDAGKQRRPSRTGPIRLLHCTGEFFGRRVYEVDTGTGDWRLETRLEKHEYGAGYAVVLAETPASNLRWLCVAPMRLSDIRARHNSGPDWSSIALRCYYCDFC